MTYKIAISQLQDKVNTRSSTLEALKVRPDENLTSFQQGVGDGNQYKGLDLTRIERDAESFAACRDDITDKATAFPSDRFQGLGHDPVLRGAATHGQQITDSRCLFCSFLSGGDPYKALRPVCNRSWNKSK